MSWVKLDDGFFRNAKAMDAGRDGKLLYLAGLCYCAASLTDGFIRRQAVPILAAEAEVNPRTADKLVAVSLWVPVDGGFEVPDYLTFNPSREQVIAQREANVSRQQSRRDKRPRHAVTNSVTNGVSVSPPIPNPKGFTSSSSSTPSIGTVDDDLVNQALALFADKKLAGTNGTVQSPQRWRDKVLRNAQDELTTQAHQWLATYDVSASQLAEALVAGTIPPSWQYSRRLA